ncbi:MAG: VOC family protein [Burkholderiaceae bacterium]|nr:VOC family protein [Burkholderiaceae bacterium]
MKSPWIEALRSVALTVPDLAAAEAFYTQVWRLEVAAREPGVVYLRGSGRDHHLLALQQRPGVPQIHKVTLRARSLAALSAIAQATPAAGGVVEQGLAAASDPAGGQRLLIRDADGRRFEIVHGDARRQADAPPPPDQPQRLAHAVLNSHAVEATRAFLEQALGFVLADRTRIMAFMNCDSDHHTLALGDTDNDALNHIAFVMPTLDAVMRGGGRMKDAGHAIHWGPGRHGPGDNAFNYFIDPFGIVIEYTAEVEQIDDSYQAGGPGDWTWPPGRIDQWGLGQPPTPELKAAQRAVFFSPFL